MVRLVERITGRDIRRIAEGDHNQLAKVRGYVYNAITSQVKGRADDATIDDLTQETILRIVGNADKYDPRYAPLTFVGLMIRRSVQGWAQSYWKRRAITNQGYFSDGEQNNGESVNNRMNRCDRYTPIDRLIDQEECERGRNQAEERIKKLRKALGEDNYEILFEHYGLEVPQSSIALARNVSLSAIKSRFNRMRVKARSVEDVD